MAYILLVISCIGIGMKSVFAKKSNSYLTETHNIYTYNFYAFSIAFLISLVLSLKSFGAVSVYTAVMATFYGIFLSSAQMSLTKAMNLGEVSISTLFYCCGFLVPMFVSIFVYDESVSFAQATGIILIIISFAVTVEKGRKGTFKWFVFIMMAFLFNGGLGVIQKVYGMADYRDEQSAFMVISFLAGAVMTFLVMPKKALLPSKGFLKTALGSGASLAVVNTININISGVLPGVIFFPAANGGGIIMSAVLALIILGEKLPKKKIWGIVIGVVAICLIAL